MDIIQVTHPFNGCMVLIFNEIFNVNSVEPDERYYHWKMIVVILRELSAWQGLALCDVCDIPMSHKGVS